MSAATFDEQASYWAREAEDAAARRLGRTVEEVRPILARTFGLSPGTLENLRRQRTKGVRAFVWDACRRAYETERQRQLKAVAHDLQTTAAIAGASDAVVVAISAVLETAQASDQSL
jgi:hypothetical protein